MDLRPGPRDHLITESIAAAIATLDSRLVEEAQLEAGEGPARFARHLMAAAERVLRSPDTSATQAERVNAVLAELGAERGDVVLVPPRLLLGIRDRTPLGDPKPLPDPPATPLSQSDLLVNAEGQPNIGSELKAELATADAVDLICAFVIWSGVRHLRDAIEAVVDRGGAVRVITTTYLGATEKRAVDELFKSAPRFGSRLMRGRRSCTRRRGCWSAAPV